MKKRNIILNKVRFKPVSRFIIPTELDDIKVIAVPI